LGQNVVLSESGEIQPPQGRPIQKGWTLARSATSITDHNEREYARVASYIMPIRDAIMCDLDETSLNWLFADGHAVTEERKVYFVDEYFGRGDYID